MGLNHTSNKKRERRTRPWDTYAPVLLAVMQQASLPGGTIVRGLTGTAAKGLQVRLHRMMAALRSRDDTPDHIAKLAASLKWDLELDARNWADNGAFTDALPAQGRPLKQDPRWHLQVWQIHGYRHEEDPALVSLQEQLDQAHPDWQDDLARLVQPVE